MANNFDRTPNRRLPGVLNKWTWFPKDVLPMWIADMDFSAPPPVLEALQRFTKHGDMGYALPSMKLYETIAARMDRLYGWKISPDMIVPIPGVNSGYNIAARTFCTSARGYLIQTPVYTEFHETRRKAGVPQVESPLVKKVTGNRIVYEVDFDRFEKVASEASMFLLCNPHNPIGSIHSSAQLKRLAQICIEQDLLIVSDEIHSELLLGNSQFRPTASLSRAIERRTITLISASKAYNVPGLFTAFAIIPNKKLRAQYADTLSKMGLHISSPGLVASQIVYSGKCDSWLKELREYLTANRDYLLEYVTKHMPSVRVTIPDATYLAWLDCTDLRLKPSPYEFFFKEARVALSDGIKFGKESSQFVRLNFGTSRKLLKEGLQRMKNALS
jgi:cystathionine beta-lyase